MTLQHTFYYYLKMSKSANQPSKMKRIKVNHPPPAKMAPARVLGRPLLKEPQATSALGTVRKKVAFSDEELREAGDTFGDIMADTFKRSRHMARSDIVYSKFLEMNKDLTEEMVQELLRGDTNAETTIASYLGYGDKARPVEYMQAGLVKMLPQLASIQNSTAQLIYHYAQKLAKSPESTYKLIYTRLASSAHVASNINDTWSSSWKTNRYPESYKVGLTDWHSYGGFLPWIITVNPNLDAAQKAFSLKVYLRVPKPTTTQVLKDDGTTEEITVVSTIASSRQCVSYYTKSEVRGNSPMIRKALSETAVNYSSMSGFLDLASDIDTTSRENYFGKGDCISPMIRITKCFSNYMLCTSRRDPETLLKYFNTKAENTSDKFGAWIKLCLNSYNKFYMRQDIDVRPEAIQVLYDDQGNLLQPSLWESTIRALTHGYDKQVKFNINAINPLSEAGPPYVLGAKKYKKGQCLADIMDKADAIMTRIRNKEDERVIRGAYPEIVYSYMKPKGEVFPWLESLPDLKGTDKTSYDYPTFLRNNPYCPKGRIIWVPNQWVGYPMQIISNLLSYSYTNYYKAICAGAFSPKLDLNQEVLIPLYSFPFVEGTFDMLFRRIMGAHPFYHGAENSGAFMMSSYSDNVYVAGRALYSDLYERVPIVDPHKLLTNTTLANFLNGGGRVLLSLDGAKMETSMTTLDVQTTLSHLCNIYKFDPVLSDFIRKVGYFCISGGVSVYGSMLLLNQFQGSGNPFTFRLNDERSYAVNLTYCKYHKINPSSLTSTNHQFDIVSWLTIAAKAGVEFTIERLTLLPPQVDGNTLIVKDNIMQVDVDFLGYSVQGAAIKSSPFQKQGDRIFLVAPVLERARLLKALSFDKSGANTHPLIKSHIFATKCLSLMLTGGIRVPGVAHTLAKGIEDGSSVFMNEETLAMAMNEDGDILVDAEILNSCSNAIFKIVTNVDMESPEVVRTRLLQYLNEKYLSIYNYKARFIMDWGDPLITGDVASSTPSKQRADDYVQLPIDFAKDPMDDEMMVTNHIPMEFANTGQLWSVRPITNQVTGKTTGMVVSVREYEERLKDFTRQIGRPSMDVKRLAAIIGNYLYTHQQFTHLSRVIPKRMIVETDHARPLLSDTDAISAAREERRLAKASRKGGAQTSSLTADKDFSLNTTAVIPHHTSVYASDKFKLAINKLQRVLKFTLNRVDGDQILSTKEAEEAGIEHSFVGSLILNGQVPYEEYRQALLTAGLPTWWAMVIPGLDVAQHLMLDSRRVPFSEYTDQDILADLDSLQKSTIALTTDAVTNRMAKSILEIAKAYENPGTKNVTELYSNLFRSLRRVLTLYIIKEMGTVNSFSALENDDANHADNSPLQHYKILHFNRPGTDFPTVFEVFDKAVKAFANTNIQTGLIPLEEDIEKAPVRKFERKPGKSVRGSMEYKQLNPTSGGRVARSIGGKGAARSMAVKVPKHTWKSADLPDSQQREG